MEFLVIMTTQVPDGTSEDAVDEVRARESTRARELAAQGNLLRLWRPPLQPGEWRTLGLFAAEDDDELEQILLSMPLRVWRSDDVTPLGAHPNDPARTSQGHRGGEFLTAFTIAVPEGTAEKTVTDTNAREANRALELAEQGHLLRLWMLPGEERALGLWRAHDVAELQALLASLPLYRWMTVETTPLSQHPNDPALVQA